MKITVICDVLGEENNGATHAAMNFINSLQSKGHDVTIVCPDQDKKGQENYFVCPARSFGPLNGYVRKVGVTIAKADDFFLETPKKDISAKTKPVTIVKCKPDVAVACKSPHLCKCE